MSTGVRSSENLAERSLGDTMGEHRQHAAGKGDSPRKVNQQKYRENYDKIFGSKKKTRNTKGKKDNNERN